MLTDDQREEVILMFEAYCEERVPLEVRDRLALQFRIVGPEVILYEKRPHFMRPAEWTESTR